MLLTSLYYTQHLWHIIRYARKYWLSIRMSIPYTESFLYIQNVSLKAPSFLWNNALYRADLYIIKEEINYQNLYHFTTWSIGLAANWIWISTMDNYNMIHDVLFGGYISRLFLRDMMFRMTHQCILDNLFFHAWRKNFEICLYWFPWRTPDYNYPHKPS